MRLMIETAQIEHKVRSGIWPHASIASDGDKYITHGDLAKILGLWNGKGLEPQSLPRDGCADVHL
jgi:hypothetical protein